MRSWKESWGFEVWGLRFKVGKMNKASIERVVAVVKQRSGEFLGAVRDTALEFSWDARDAAQAGFGVPKLVSSVAALSVAVVAASGTAAIGLDAVGKVFGKRECTGCNGWEGLRCTMCAGRGMVQYHVSDFGIPAGENESLQSMAAAIAAGRAKLGHVPASLNLGLPLPSRECPNCEGTGVMKCTECKGQALKPKISFDDVMDVPWKAWDVYRKIEPPKETVPKSITDPDTAAWWMFGRVELERGVQFDEDVKQKMMWQWAEDRRYDEVREKVERREPGWEDLQEVLGNIDSGRAMRDPLIVPNVPHYKARIKLEAEVNQLQPPPRPANWGGTRRPLSEADWSKEDLKDPKKGAEMTALLEGQENFVGSLLDSAWEREWREQQIEVLSKERIDSYIHNKEEEARNPKPSPAPTRDAEDSKAAPTASSRDSRASQQKGSNKKQAADENKKKERQERADRLARQAADREASLAKAKAAREHRT